MGIRRPAGDRIVGGTVLPRTDRPTMSTTLLSEPPLKPAHEVFHVGRILKPHEPTPRRGHKVIAVLPAYNAEKTLAATLADFPAGCVDEILLVDDGSTDRTVAIARE